MKAIAAALERLDYEAVPEAMYMQWKKHFNFRGQDREIRVDLLVGPLGQFRERLHVKGVRARRIGPIKLTPIQWKKPFISSSLVILASRYLA
jgi:hypothetical protein